MRSLVSGTLQPVSSDRAIGRVFFFPIMSSRASRGLRRVLAAVELAQQILEAIRDSLVDNVIVDPLKDIAQAALVLTAEASGLSRYGVRLHSCLWPWRGLLRKL